MKPISDIPLTASQVSINSSRKSIIPQQGPQEPLWSLSNHMQARWNCHSPIMSKRPQKLLSNHTLQMKIYNKMQWLHGYVHRHTQPERSMFSDIHQNGNNCIAITYIHIWRLQLCLVSRQFIQHLDVQFKLESRKTRSGRCVIEWQTTESGPKAEEMTSNADQKSKSKINQTHFTKQFEHFSVLKNYNKSKKSIFCFVIL